MRKNTVTALKYCYFRTKLRGHFSIPQYFINASKIPWIQTVSWHAFERLLQKRSRDAIPQIFGLGGIRNGTLFEGLIDEEGEMKRRRMKKGSGAQGQRGKGKEYQNEVPPLFLFGSDFI